MAYTSRDDLNYLGVLYEIGANQTPFLNLIGGLQGGGATISKSFLFPIAQPYALTAASQPAITEADSVTSNTATTVTRGQDLNTVQIFQYTVEVSKAKQSTSGELSGLSALGVQPVTDEFEFQKMAQFRQMAIDLEYSMINGSYQAAATSATAAKMRGLINAITTNTTAAAGATLTKALMDGVLAEMATTGAPFDNILIMCNAFQKQKLTDIYGYVPTDRFIGGSNITRIVTDFCTADVVFNPHVATDDVIIVDLSVCKPVFVPVDGQVLTFEELAKVAASKKGEWYAQIGLDYGPEEYHGSITGLATS